MNQNRYLFLLLLIILFPAVKASVSDTVINRNVTVERVYKPVIQPAGKISSNPKEIELISEKIVPKFTEFNFPLSVDNNIHTLDAADLQRRRSVFSDKGYARLGFGNYFNTLADFAYPLVNKEDTKFDFSVSHLGTFGSKAHSATHADLFFDKYYNTFCLYASLGLGHEYLKYYGKNYNQADTAVDLSKEAKIFTSEQLVEQYPQTFNKRVPLSRTLYELSNDPSYATFWRFNVLAGAKSLNLVDDVKFNASLQFKSFASVNLFSEKDIEAKLGLDIPLPTNRAGINVNFNNLTYKSSNVSNSYYFDDSYTTLIINPYYSISGTDYDVKLGAKLNLQFGYSPAFNPAPDVMAEWRAIPKYFSLYAGLTGKLELNSMDKMFTENRYLYPDVQVKNTIIPIDTYAGFKLKLLDNLLLDAFVNYQFMKDQYFFVNKEYRSVTIPNADSVLFTNRFNVIYSNAELLKIGGRLAYNYKSIINLQLKTAYNYWDVKDFVYAWNFPAWETDFTADVHFTRDFSATASIFYKGERYAKLASNVLRMQPITDMNIGLNYLYNDWITCFLKVNNLLDNRYQYYFGYDVQGINLVVGAAISF